MSQLIGAFNVIVIVLNLHPHLSHKQQFFSSSYIFLITQSSLCPKLVLEVSIASKRPSVPCFGYQSPFKNLITRENMSCTPFAKVSKHTTI